MVHSVTTRKYIKTPQIRELAKKKYDANGQGIAIMDLQAAFRLTKGQAQRRLKILLMEKFLFTADDLIKQGINLVGFKRDRPQKYYLTEMKARIIEDNKNNVQNGTTGISPIEQQKMQTFSELLTQLASPSLLYTHKLQIRTRINKEHYDELSLPVKGISKAKYHL